MTSFFLNYQTTFDLFLLSLGLAFSQQVVMKAGVFSVATAGFAAVAAYVAAILTMSGGYHPILSTAVASVVGAGLGWLLSIPLARLRGVFQAIATLAFVEIVVAIAFATEHLTGGAAGISGIPKVVQTWHLVVIVGAVCIVMMATARSGVGRAFDVLREDETVATSLGISAERYHTLAFVISGAVGGLFGALTAFYSYGIDPGQFGFPLVVAILTAIVLGGRTTVAGPIVGCAIMAALPELARPLAEYRPMVNGVLLLVIISFLPHGVADSLILRWRQAKVARAEVSRRREEGGHHAKSST